MMSDAELKTEVPRVLDYLAASPRRNHIAVTHQVLKAVMLQTAGILTREEGSYDIVKKSLGGGVWRLSLRVAQ